MITKTFSRDYLMEELDLPWSSSPYLVESTLVDTSRWSLYYDLVFRDKDGSYWATYYSTGATEMQDESPWEYDKEIECTQVQAMPKVVFEYVPVGEEIVYTKDEREKIEEAFGNYFYQMEPLSEIPEFKENI